MANACVFARKACHRPFVPGFPTFQGPRYRSSPSMLPSALARVRNGISATPKPLSLSLFLSFSLFLPLSRLQTDSRKNERTKTEAFSGKFSCRRDGNRWITRFHQRTKDRRAINSCRGLSSNRDRDRSPATAGNGSRAVFSRQTRSRRVSGIDYVTAIDPALRS